MNDPRRLHDGGGTNVARRLIAAARRDDPPNGAVARALLALGVASGVALLPAASHAASIGAAKTAGASVTALSVAKWLGIGIVGGTLTVAGSRALSPDQQNSVAPAASTPARVAPSPPKTTGTPPTEAFAETPTVPSTPSPDRSAAGNQPSSLAEELALLERARRALTNGRPGEARDLLGLHRERFRPAALAEEAAVLRVEVSLAHGERDLAEQAARDFLAAYPRSPHAPRVRSLLTKATGDPNGVERPWKR
jgi:hypothetical protein